MAKVYQTKKGKNGVAKPPMPSEVKKKWADFKNVPKSKSDFVISKFDATEWTW